MVFPVFLGSFYVILLVECVRVRVCAIISQDEVEKHLQANAALDEPTLPSSWKQEELLEVGCRDCSGGMRNHAVSGADNGAPDSGIEGSGINGGGHPFVGEPSAGMRANIQVGRHGQQMGGASTELSSPVPTPIELEDARSNSLIQDRSWKREVSWVSEAASLEGVLSAELAGADASHVGVLVTVLISVFVLAGGICFCCRASPSNPGDGSQEGAEYSAAVRGLQENGASFDVQPDGTAKLTLPPRR